MELRRIISQILFFLLIITLPLVATGEFDRNPEIEGAIVQELNAIAPEAVPDFEAATAALDSELLEDAAAGYRRVLEVAPEFDPAMRRLGSALVQLGQYEEGVELIEEAVQIRRSAPNLFTLGVCLVFPGPDREPLNQDVSRAYSLVKEAEELDPKDSSYLLARAQIALHLENIEGFRDATQKLYARFPRDASTHYYAAVKAALDEDWTLAEAEIKHAGKRGLPQEVVDDFLANVIGTRVSMWFWAKIVGIATAVWVAGLLILFVLGKVMSGMTLASLERDDPNKQITESTRRLRSVYRFVVTVSGVYWYVSLPFVAIMVIALTVSVIYGFVMLGTIPIKLVFLLVIGAIVSVIAIVVSLFVRVRDDEDPGRAVTEEDAPGLWEIVREVAAKVGTRPVDQIWLTPGTEVAVYERGGMRDKMNDRSKRALLLGAGVLQGFDQTAFRSVLSHEYGHFTHRDTAGGDVALRVQNGMFRFAIALAESGFAVWWNLAFQFLRLYDFLYRRISHGATRLQEVLADRIAIRNYGLDTFTTGLTHVVRSSIFFENVADREIQTALEKKRPIANLYVLPAPTDEETVKDLELQVKQVLESETTEDDTHPSPKDRFRFGAQVDCDGSEPSSGAVWDLFRDQEGIKKELTAVVSGRIAENIKISEEEAV